MPLKVKIRVLTKNTVTIELIDLDNEEMQIFLCHLQAQQILFVLPGEWFRSSRADLNVDLWTKNKRIFQSLGEEKQCLSRKYFFVLVNHLFFSS